MIRTAEHPATNLYRVEVSGWDDKKAFFVENSELKWAEDSGKQVTLNRGLSEGAVIFLRLLQPISNDRSHPVATEQSWWRGTLKVSGNFACNRCLRAAGQNCCKGAAKWSGESVEMEHGSEMVARLRPASPRKSLARHHAKGLEAPY
jgi:hypothetical protein